MSHYQAPVKDILFAIKELAGLTDIQALGFDSSSEDIVEAVLREAANLAESVIAPTNTAGDQQGAHLENGVVRLPDGFHEAYQAFVDGGWPGLAMDEAYGGQGLPFILGIPVSEIWQSANLAWSNCAMLTSGAVSAVEAHGSDELKRVYLEKLITGQWTGTMNLTEPQAGSDLALLRSTATRQDDHYLISGQKIFITYGDHEMADNICHLVLARLPDAPAGVRGISLFLVPKYLVNEDGSLGPRNPVQPASLEHKLGIHGSPTCVMNFEKAVGFLIGEENHGLTCMFTMMNHARIQVGVQGLGVAERAYQQAVSYARERLQGTAPGEDETVPIIRHADVRRMLMTMKSQIEAMRALAAVTAGYVDRAEHTVSDQERKLHQSRVDLFTPIVKCWCTEVGIEIASLGIQIHGGMGFIEETGAAQYYRDARITTIYEGTSGIQAMDFVGRKIMRDEGEAALAWTAEMNSLADEVAADKACEHLVKPFQEALQAFGQALQWLSKHAMDDPDVPGSVGYPLLMTAGNIAGAAMLLKSALVASAYLKQGVEDEAFYHAKLVTARFYVEHILPRVFSLTREISAGSTSIMALDEASFDSV